MLRHMCKRQELTEKAGYRPSFQVRQLESHDAVFWHQHWYIRAPHDSSRLKKRDTWKAQRQPVFLLTSCKHFGKKERKGCEGKKRINQALFIGSVVPLCSGV